MITYRKAAPNDIRPALDLAYRVFMEYDAPDYEPIGAVNFKKYCIEYDIYTERLLSGENMMFIALDGDKIVGMTAERDNGEILLLFVDGGYHRQGIATKLLSDMICTLKLQGFDKITLDSSPHALPFYLKYGFQQTGEARNFYGCVLTPMEYTPKEIWDVLDENGNKTGRFHERGRPMATGDYHLCVHVWKHNSRGEWLIDKRRSKSLDDINGGKWETTGGAAIAGDDSLTAALRETKEELGLDLDPAKGVLFRRFAREGYNGHTYLMDVWVFEHDCAIDSIRFQEGETCEAMWATADQIREMIDSGEFLSEWFYPYFNEMIEKWRAMKIVRFNDKILNLLPQPQEEFEIIGRLIPAYNGKEWSISEELIDKPYMKTYPNDVFDPTIYIDNPNEAAFIAMLDGQRVGSIRVCRRWNKNAFIDDLLVDKAYRGCGAGTMLMDAAVNWGKENGCHGISLETQDNNLLACRFYLKYGFKLGGIDCNSYDAFPTRDETALYFYLLP